MLKEEKEVACSLSKSIKFSSFKLGILSRMSEQYRKLPFIRGKKLSDSRLNELDVAFFAIHLARNQNVVNDSAYWFVRHLWMIGIEVLKGFEARCLNLRLYHGTKCLLCNFYVVRGAFLNWNFYGNLQSQSFWKKSPKKNLKFLCFPESQ